jgi:hypothetical protein
MQYEDKTEHLAFEPYRFTIGVESEEELLYLYHLFNMSGSDMFSTYDGSRSKKFNRSELRDMHSRNSNAAWRMIDNECRRRGIK